MVSCEDCPAICCKYVTVKIDKPGNQDDFDNIKWYVAHKNVFVYEDHDGDWYVEFKTECEFLDDNKCSIHPKNENNKHDFISPDVCQVHDADDCEFTNLKNSPYKRIFKNLEQVDKYVKSRWPPRKERKF